MNNKSHKYCTFNIIKHYKPKVKCVTVSVVILSKLKRGYVLSPSFYLLSLIGILAG